MIAAHKLSKVFGLNIAEGPKGNYRSKSQKLFSELGLVRVNGGIGTFFPIFLKSLRKLETLVRQKMDEISAIEILLPSMTDWKLLEKSGRSHLTDIFKLQESQGTNYYLNPTCEEAITDLLASVNGLNHSQLPCRFYQISSKFRNEKRSRSGLIRTREFIMKDLYCIDSSREESEITYNEVKKKYHDFFQLLNVPYVCIQGSENEISGIYSHEFHFLSDVGDDIIISCQECGYNENLNCIQNFDHSCPSCRSKNVKECRGIEVGHTFHLGTKYSEPFNATYEDKNGKHELLHMNSFGLGLTRILSASVDVMALDEQIKWPIQVAPYLICVIPPKVGSKEEAVAENLMPSVLHDLLKNFKDDVILDDRTHLTIGKRFSKVKMLGFPYVLIIGKDICKDSPSVEIHDVYKGVTNRVQISDIVQFFQNLLRR